MRIHTLMFGLAMTAAAWPAADTAAADQVFTSPAAQAHLLELYTSEGCSSCPPADRWLSGLTETGQLWRSVVPVAFHVTYWDQLGWPDQFANPANDRRQRQVAAAAGTGVYTPGVYLDGNEWRSWRRRGTPPDGGPDDTGVLQVTLGSDHLDIRFTPSGTSSNRAQTAHIAWLQAGQATDVKAGENRGKRLQHDFVVRHLQQVQLQTTTGTSGARLGVGGAAAARADALAVWVTDAAGQPVQATGGWLHQ